MVEKFPAQKPRPTLGVLENILGNIAHLGEAKARQAAIEHKGIQAAVDDNGYFSAGRASRVRYKGEEYVVFVIDDVSRRICLRKDINDSYEKGFFVDPRNVAVIE